MNDEKNNIENEIYTNADNLKIADDVALDILHPEEKNRKTFIFLVLMLLVLLTSLISFICFSMADRFNDVKDNTITTGSVVFSFNDSRNYINMINVYPISDDVGMKLNGKGEMYEFSVSEKYYGKPHSGKKTKYANYEVSLILDKKNTISPQHIKIYLLKNGKEVKINNKTINRVFDLPKSKVRKNGYTLIRNRVDRDSYDQYVFRMWLSTDYNVDNVYRVFKCYIGVDSY